MIEPYTAIALSTRVSACRTRADYMRNVEHINSFMDIAYGMAATCVPLAELAKFGGAYSLKAGQAIAKGEPLFMRADGKLPEPAPAV